MRTAIFNSSLSTYSLFLNKPHSFLHAAPSRTLQYKNRYGFLNQKEYDSLAYPKAEGTLNRLKQLLGIGRFVLLNGMKELYADMKVVLPIWQKNIRKIVLQPQEEAIFTEALSTFNKLFKIMLISILPFSGPLIILILAIYPSSAPNQFLTENDYSSARIELLRKQLLAIDFYRTNEITTPPKFQDIQNLQHAKKLSQLLFGEYRDGTVGYSRVTCKNIPYLFSQSYSLWFCKFNLTRYFHKDFANRKIFAKMDIDEKIAWKFQQVMKLKQIIDYGNIKLPPDVMALQINLQQKAKNQEKIND